MDDVMEKITSLDKFLKEEKDGAVLAVIHELLVVAAKQHATKEGKK